MARHLKTRIISRLDCIISHFVPNSEISASPSRGVRYFVPIELIDSLWGAMNTHKEGRRYRKHIIVRHYPKNRSVFQLYTYHFPKIWSEACVANRNLIKTAQQLAHALEHDYSPIGMEWRLRFFRHYFLVVKGGAQPEPGLKPYSHFFTYAYVSIYRELQAATQKVASVPDSTSAVEPSLPTPEDVSFDPINPRPLRTLRRYPLHALIHRASLSEPSCTLPVGSPPLTASSIMPNVIRFPLPLPLP